MSQKSLSSSVANNSTSEAPVTPVTPVTSVATLPAGLPGDASPLVFSSAEERRWPRWMGVVVVALLFIVGGTYGAYQVWNSNVRIAPNLFIADVPVGSLTREEAIKNLKARFGKSSVKLEAPGRKWHLTLHELGGTPDFNRVVNNAYWFGRSGNPLQDLPRLMKANFDERHLPLGVRWNKAQLKRRMRQVAKAYHRPARDAKLEVKDVGVIIQPEINGRELNVGETLARLQRRYDLHHTKIEASVRAVKPRLTAASLEGADVKLGSFGTRFNRGLIGRTRNIHVASATIDGKVLMPGDTFSFNASTGERTWEKGYRMAHIFERKPGKKESEVVDGLAGGVCQVSTTLYNAVRKGNRKVDSALKIVQRESHSLPVPYIASGLDATVAWPNRDFKFQNTLPHPIYLRSAVNGSRLNISVWARMPQSAAIQFAQNEDENSRG
ncbi:MAG TPA: VanW family protein [Abditibacteriaceae bacterium]|jgi:vancomycin resistance protein YoaR